MSDAHVTAIKKSDSPKRMIWSEVYAPNRPDADAEFMTAETIEKMAYDFMRDLKQNKVDAFHDQKDKDGCCVVETFIARKNDPDFIEGAWVVGIHVNNDDLWEKIEKGEINGLSVEALVIKETKEVELEIPPILQGTTMKSEGGTAEDHTHIFEVHYDDDGKFLGGRTDNVDNHFHLIRKGTVTETTNGHFHKYSHTEALKISTKE